jgi:hypothetical protein
MRQARMQIGAFVCLLALAIAAPSPAQNVRGGACGEIRGACRDAGFTAGGRRQGAGLMADCVAPIMQAKAQPKRASRPLPQVDPQLVADCKAANPTFGQGGRVPPPVQTPATPPQPVEAAPSPPPPAAQHGKRPNIVFILTDDLAVNLVQYMPHVLDMQKNGVSFPNYFVTDSLCCPSRSSIFTGRFPHDTGIFRNTGNDGAFLAFHNRHHERSTFATALADRRA